MISLRKILRPEMAPLVATVSVAVTELLSKLLGPRARVFAKAMVMERLNPNWVNDTKFGPVAFYCPATWPYARSDMAKEPETTRWIEEFPDGDTFWDIGANVGVYSLLAARKGHRVVAFEPSAVSYFVLSKNIELNAFDRLITFLNVAITDRSRMSELHMSNTLLGGAQHNFGVAHGNQNQDSSMFKQSCIGFSVDDILRIYDLPFPNQIKIDVDGLEDKVIMGARQTLRDHRLKSVLIEINGDAALLMIDGEMTDAGLKRVFATKGAGRSGNHIFRRVQ